METLRSWVLSSVEYLHLKDVNGWNARRLLVAGGVSGLALLVLEIYRLRRQTVNTPEMRECREEFRPDLVYLWSFPRPRRCLPDLSPYALKVETFLRIAKIPYQMHHIKFNERSEKGQIPFLFLNGCQYSDSTVMIKVLQEHFKVDLESQVSEEATASGHALARMLDQATVWTYFYYRYVIARMKLWRAVDLPYNHYLTFMISTLTAYGMKRRSAQQGAGRLSEKEMWSVAYDDLKAISQYLGDKDYMLGNEATSVDAVMFGHLAQIIYIDVDYPHRAFITNDFPNIKRYVERIREVYWPDWCEIIRG